MYVCRQLNNEPAEISIKVASFRGQFRRTTQSFFQKSQNAENNIKLFPNPAGSTARIKISSVEELFHGKVLFSSQFETKFQLFPCSSPLFPYFYNLPLIFLGSKTPQKHLLCRLVVSHIISNPYLYQHHPTQYTVVHRSKQN